MNDQSHNKPPSSFLKTDGGKTKSNAIEVPSITLPKGGGAIKGIDEKFSVNAANGTASLSIPLPFAPSRGATPALNLSYNSGSGNGVFGLGWNLSLASIKRKTDKGLPKYCDNIDSDIFLFSEAEDLVPEFKKSNGGFLKVNGEYVISEKDYPNAAPYTHKIRYYKPRTEGLFARIERWTEKANGIIKWRVITRDNITTLFGWTDKARIEDPADPARIYQWLPEFVFDDKGNCSHYYYQQDKTDSIDKASLHDRNRIKQNQLTFTNRYLQKVLYGNTEPYNKFNDPFIADDKFLFETVFDYGEPAIKPDIINTAKSRTDAFSDYKAGFEIRTTRLCKRVLLFHHFAEYDGLVRSLDFIYDLTVQEDFTFLKSVTTKGYIKKSDGTYSQKNLPPIEFAYQSHDWNKEIKAISSENFVHAPSGLDEGQYQFTDLFNEGLSGILTEQAGGWYYKHNLGNGQFEHAKLISPRPSFSGLGSQLQLADLDANGGKQLVNYSAEPKGYFDLNDDEEWQPFKNFKNLPHIDLNDLNTRMLDLNGDGKADILISEDNIFTWFESAGKKGFENNYRTEKSFDEENGPAIVFADSTQSIFLADMSGDGLSDIVRIRNGEICYWPNFGYGKFGAKVLMDHSPVFDLPGAFKTSLIRMADIDGSGTTDIIYLGKNKFSCWSNLSGNSFSTAPFEIDAFPDIHNQSKITVTDLLGNGVACIVWSSPMAKDAHSPLRYIDLMNSKKPHVMIGYKNNMGKEVSMEYKPSTQFYLEDKKAGKPWATKLHFPVHCIAKTETRDRISGYLFVSTYKYHHGYYDHAEREFRGFGMVEQQDVEDFEQWKKREGTNVLDENDLNQPPVISKTWVHTGAFLSNEEILTQFKKEYWFEEMDRQKFPVTANEHELPDATVIDEKGNVIATGKMDAQDWQEALRACKGMTLRTEIFSKDADKQKELTPYSTAAHNCIIQRLQPRGKNKHAIFIAKESEAITYSYERNTDDPRIAHNLNIKFDSIGNVLESASIVYPRKLENITRFETVNKITLPATTKKAQGATYIIYTENRFTGNDIDDDNHYRLRLPAEIKTYQLKGVNKKADYYSLKDFTNILTTGDTALYHETEKKPTIISLPGEPVVYKPLKRLIEHIRTIYRGNNLIGALPLGQMESLALPFESYQLAYTTELLHDIYNEKKTDVELAALMLAGNFVHSEGDINWWIQSGQTNFIDNADPLANTLAKAKDRFYLPISYTDPYGSITKVEYEHNKLFVKKTTDAQLNEFTVTKFNYRTLSSQQMKDINDNLSGVITDELGLVKAMAVMGKGTQADELAGLEEITENEQADITTFFQVANAAGVCRSDDLQASAKKLLKYATTRFIYDFDAYYKTGKPAVVSSIVRETHYRDKNEIPHTVYSKLQLSFEYSNGLGKVIMKKVQAEPGKAKQVIIVDNNITVTNPGPNTSPFLRWIGNGRTILNNKGNPVKQYEPFFSVSPKFEGEKELVETGVTPILYYDAMNRLIKTELPDGTFSKTEFESWQQKVFDTNDTVTDSVWYKRRTDSHRTDYITDVNEQAAALKAEEHDKTPSQFHVDTLGRPVLSIEHNKNTATGADEFYKTKIELDIEGTLRKVTDARELPANNNEGNIVMEYKYDMLGNKVYQKSMDAGQRWLMLNIAGNPLRTWDERDHEIQYEYDKLHRPTQSIVINKIGQNGDKLLNNIFDKIIYGESLVLLNRTNETAIKSKNLLGKPFRHFDTGGLLETPEYDFKGQPTSTTRKVSKDYKNVVDWTDTSITPALLANVFDVDIFTFITETDAIGRITKQVAPDNSIILPSYNEAGLLNGETVEHFKPASLTEYIKDIDYNEKGQRTKIIYGNDVTTRYEYDKETFRLRSLLSFHTSLGSTTQKLQDLNYTYDPVGNILRIEDKADDTTFFRNMQVEPVSEYSYDSLYRLKEATGRENNTALNFSGNDNWNDGPKMMTHQPGDPMAVVQYTQRYTYDEVGNIKEMNHLNSWKRIFEYETDSNRLKKTTVGQGPNSDVFKYSHHSEHGYITELPHLVDMGWNFKEELILSSKQKVTSGTPETTYYQYDGQGQRIRKITENYSAANNPIKKDERIYIAGYETYRTYNANVKNFERESLSLMDKEHRFVMIETVKDTFTPPVGEQVRTTRYQFHNHLGSACLETDERAAVISYEEYHPYGTTAYQAKSVVIKCAAKRYRYTGMERDEETGLSYHSARYYLPWLGRWATCDPIGIEGGINMFVYCNNSPLVNSDVFGTDSTTKTEPDSPDRKSEIKTVKEYNTNEIIQKHLDSDRLLSKKLIISIAEVDKNVQTKLIEEYGKDWKKSLDKYQDIFIENNFRTFLQSISKIDLGPILKFDPKKEINFTGSEYESKVRFVIEQAIETADRSNPNDISYNKLILAFQFIVALRELDPKLSQSIIFRNADHYLASRLAEYRRSIPGNDYIKTMGIPPTIEESKRGLIAAETYDFGKSIGVISGKTKSQPTPPGGIEWVKLGIEDYLKNDLQSTSKKPEVGHIKSTKIFIGGRLFEY